MSMTTGVVLLAAMAFFAISSVSAVPSTMNFQGRLTDASGVTMPDGLYNMQFKLFTASSGGSSVWDETRETTARVQVTNGLFATKLGEVTPIPASLFASGNLYFEITMATPGTATCNTASCASWESPMTPRQQMATSAYAFQAENANSLGGVDSANFARRDTSNTFTGSTQVFQNTTNSTTAFQVQNAAGISLLGVDTVNNQLTIRGFDDNFTRGPELITDGDFSGAAWTASGWTTTTTDASSDDQDGNASLNTGQFTVIPGDYYQVTFDVSGHTYPLDCLQVSIGNNYGDDDFCAATQLSAGTDSLIIQASDADPLTFYAYGSSVTVSNVSVRHLTYAPSNSVIALQNAQGETTLEIRTGGINNTNGMKTVNTFIGLSSGANNISGYANTSLGNYSLQANSTGSNNTTVGSSSLKNNTTGESNTALGVESLYANTSGSYNTAIGNFSLISNTTGNSNVAIGRQSLIDNTDGSGNTAIGIQSLNNNTSGNYNVAIGYESLRSNTTGSGNSAIGYQAGYQDQDSWASGANLQNSTAIGAYSQVQANNSIVLGSGFAATKVGIGITVPSNMFSVSGRHYSTGSATRTSGSAVVTGTGTSWTSAMVGDIIIFADGVTKQVSSVASTTSLTMNSNSAVTDSTPVAYRMHYPGFQVSSNGDTWVQKTSATAFRVQDSLGASSIFTADTTNSRIIIGSTTTNNTAIVFALDNYNQATDPTGVNGGMYYNTNLNKFRCYQNGAWADCITAAGSGANTSLSNIASTNLSAALNTTAGNLTLQTTTSGNIVLNAAGTTELQDDTNVGGNLTVAATKSLTLVGGTTAQRPGSPTEGMMFFDTDTDKLLVYSNGKWQADRSTATKIVGTSASGGTSSAVASQSPDSADFVNTSTTSAQTVINSAITALPAAGGTIYLMEGTYVVDGSINIPSNVTFTGAGAGTIIKVKNATNAALVVLNSSATTGVTIRDLTLEGNKANNSSGVQYGMDTTVSGSAGLVIDSIVAKNFRQDGILVRSSNDVMIKNSTFSGNTVSGIFVQNTQYSTVSNNIAISNGSYGMQIDGGHNTISGNVARSSTSGAGFYIPSSYSTITGNSSYGNSTYGFWISSMYSTVSNNTSSVNTNAGFYIAAFNTVVSGNTVTSNTGPGILMLTVSNNQITGNRLHNNGSTGATSSIAFQPSGGAADNSIVDNYITDTAGTGYAILISSANATGTFLSGNVFSGTGATTISDTGANTIYSNQSTSAGGLNLLTRQSASATAFQIQNASSVAILTADTTNSRINIGSTTTDATAIVFALDNYNQATDPTGINGGMYYNTNLNKLRCYENGAWADCITAAGSGANTSLSNIASTNLSAALNTTAGNLTLQTTTSGNIILNAAGTTELQDDTNVGGNLTIAASKSLTLNGGNTASRPASPVEGMLYYDTTTKQLLTYANTKWQADRTGATKVVAMGAPAGCTGTVPVASQNYDAADYVVTSCTSAQTTINSAIAALPATGGTVYLMEGTYIIDGAITPAAKTRLVGAGSGTVITLKNAINATVDAITVGSVNEVEISNLSLNGNKANNSSGAQVGIGIGTSGSATQAGTNMHDLTISNFRSEGIKLVTGKSSRVTNSSIFSNDIGVSFNGVTEMTVSNNTISSNVTRGIAIFSTNSTISGNMMRANGTAIYAQSAGHNTISNNTITASTSTGISLSSSSNYNTVTGNTITGGSAEGIFTSSSSHNVIANNVVEGNASHGISVSFVSDYNNVSNNKIHNNGGSGSTHGIYVYWATSNNRIVDNAITDTAGTGYAINVINFSGSSTQNYIAGNTYSGTGATTLNEGATSTIFGGQIDSSTNYRIQPAGTIELLKNTNVTGTLTVSGTTTLNGSLAVNNAAVFKNTSDSTNAFQIQNAATTALFTANTSNMRLEIGSGVEIKLMGVGNTYNALTKDFTCTATEAVYDIVIITGAATVGQAGGGASNSQSVAGIVVAKPDSTTCTLALEGTVQVNYGGGTATIGDTVITSGSPGLAATTNVPNAGADIGKAISAKDGSNLGWVLLD